jgi:hypothetical protein
MHFPEHSGEIAGNPRKLRGKWKQYSQRKLTGTFRSFSSQIQPETRWKAAGKNPTISKPETSHQIQTETRWKATGKHPAISEPETSHQKKLDTTVSGRQTDWCSAPFSPVISLAFR